MKPSICEIRHCNKLAMSATHRFCKGCNDNLFGVPNMKETKTVFTPDEKIIQRTKEFFPGKKYIHCKTGDIYYGLLLYYEASNGHSRTLKILYLCPNPKDKTELSPFNGRHVKEFFEDVEYGGKVQPRFKDG